MREIQSSSQNPAGRPWTPTNFADAQSGALVQLFLIAKQLGQLDEFVESIETNAESKPNDLKALEKSAQVYILANDNDNAIKAIERLIALSPRDYTYIKTKLHYVLRKNLDYETAKNYLDSLSPFTMETRLWDACRLATTLRYRGKRDDAKRLIFETGFSVNDPYKTTTNTKVIFEVFRVLTELGDMGRSGGVAIAICFSGRSILRLKRHIVSNRRTMRRCIVTSRMLTCAMDRLTKR